MKTFKELFLTLSTAAVFFIASDVAAQDAAPVTVFYEALSPYGQWMYDKTYGYVWTPSDKKFRPYYTNGYWVMTEHGSTWVSN